MTAPGQRFWKRCGRASKWCAILAAVVLFLFFGAFAYLHWIGVPEFAKARIEAALRRQGADLSLGSVRLSGFRSLVAHNLALSGRNQPGGPELDVAQAEIRLNRRALMEMAVQVDSLSLSQARVIFPLSGADPSGERFAFNHISGELQFLEGDRWYLSEFGGAFSSIRFRLSGVVTNASLFRPFKSSAKTSRAVDWPVLISSIQQHVANLGVAEASDLSLFVAGDGRNPHSFTARLSIAAPRADTVWGQIDAFSLNADISPSADNPFILHADLRVAADGISLPDVRVNQALFSAEALFSLTNRALLNARWKLQGDSLSGPWGSVTPLACSGTTVPDPNSPAFCASEIAVQLDQAETPLGRAGKSKLDLVLSHSLTNFLSFSADARFSASGLDSRWGSIGELGFSGKFDRSHSPENTARARSAWGPLAPLAPFSGGWQLHLRGLNSPRIEIENLECAGRWRAPDLAITDLKAELYGGKFLGSVGLEVDTRKLSARAEFDFDAHRISSFLTPGSQRWLRQFTWEKPPAVAAEVALIMPAWTNSRPDWRGEVRPTVTLAGAFSGGAGTFRNVPVTGARSTFSMTNLNWRLPDLTVSRPEGEIRLDYQWEMDSRDYHWILEGAVDVTALRPMLDAPQQRALDMVQFPGPPPSIKGEIWGRWHDLGRTGFRAQVAATNFVVRGEQCDELRASITYTNKFLNFANIEARRGAQVITAPSAGLDPVEHLLYATNVFSTFDPHVVTRIIGPRTHAAMQPYQFAEPPTIRLNGVIPVSQDAIADAHFQIEGNNFSYWRFRSPVLAGDVFWRGRQFSVTNVQASFYGGQLHWNGDFDTAATNGTNFRFHGRAVNSDLNLLMADLLKTTNRFEGLLTADFTVESANSRGFDTWNGRGNVSLEDGFLWNIPAFGFFSPMLNRIVPDIGNSKVRSGTATFEMINGVLHTSDLELRSSPVRLQYVGTVDFDGNLDARMQAELLRDVGAIGRVLSFALWPITKVFEYKITGTLAKPESEPLYIPSIFFLPFRPFQAVRDYIFDEPPKE